jgi:hypothetical protein
VKGAVFFGAASYEREDAAMIAVAKALVDVLEGQSIEPDEDHPIEVVSAYLKEPETEGLTEFRAVLMRAGLDAEFIEAQVVLARAAGGEVIVSAFLPDEPEMPPPPAKGMN